MKLEELRQQVDELDNEIVKLLAKRLKLAVEIGDIKNRLSQSITDTRREARVIEHIKELSHQQKLDPDAIEGIYRQIMSAAKSVQGIVVAFQGEMGAYSQEAALSFFGPRVETSPCETLEDVFKAVEQNAVNFGIVPVENSLEGSISKTYDLLLDSNLKVCGEMKLRVSHCLIANPGVTLDGIKKVYSHPQALGQCQAFLKHLNSELIPTYDTAGSVKMIKEKKIMDGAAIASTRAAEIYHMQIITCGLEDTPNNFTRFFILAQHDSPPTGSDKTSLVFSVKHRPGALYGFLKDLADKNINLTKIESRPTRQKPWEYNFYLDFEGHREDASARETLQSLEDYATFIKVLGSYPKARASAGE